MGLWDEAGRKPALRVLDEKSKAEIWASLACRWRPCWHDDKHEHKDLAHPRKKILRQIADFFHRVDGMGAGIFRNRKVERFGRVEPDRGVGVWLRKTWAAQIFSRLQAGRGVPRERRRATRAVFFADPAVFSSILRPLPIKSTCPSAARAGVSSSPPRARPSQAGCGFMHTS
jgi:hypothetical protein